VNIAWKYKEGEDNRDQGNTVLRLVQALGFLCYEKEKDSRRIL
jgi:hypothetical protein